ncbi:MAG TPA: hypothetical protein VGN23_05775 [Verrucomicrobiae bacterium]|jgi:hypothetical protein
MKNTLFIGLMIFASLLASCSKQPMSAQDERKAEMTRRQVEDAHRKAEDDQRRIEDERRRTEDERRREEDALWRAEDESNRLAHAAFGNSTPQSPAQ